MAANESHPSRARCCGIWKIDHDEPIETPTNELLAWYATFVYHLDDTVSVQIFLNAWHQGEPADDVFRLAAS